MQTCYYEINNGVFLSVLDLQDIELYVESETLIKFLITRLNVYRKYRNQGVARKLMTACCNDADAEGQTLWLEFAPYPETDPVRLRAFYERMGFRETCHEGLFKRLPRNLT